MATYYVRKTGNNANPGTDGSPRLTIASGISLLSSGDTLVIGDGTYTEQVVASVAGTLGAHTTIKAENARQVLIRPGGAGYGAVQISANYVTVEGLDVSWDANRANGAHGITQHSGSSAYHHVTIRNCASHGNTESGLSFAYADHFLVEDCDFYNNCWGGWFSGLSFYQLRDSSGQTDTIDGTFRNVIRRCRAWDNVESRTLSGGARGSHSDGNGFIMDDFQHTQSYGPDPATWLGVVYPHQTLIEQCVAFHNGAKGIQCTWADNVTVRNCVAWKNNRDLNVDDWRGELNNQASKNNIWANNIGVTDTSIDSFNAALGNQAYTGNPCTGTIFHNNIAYDTNAPGDNAIDVQGGAPGISGATGNLLATNPLLTAPGTNPATADWTLQSGSPAINAGTDAYGLPATDLAGNVRVSGAAVDIGAYEFGSVSALLNLMVYSAGGAPTQIRHVNAEEVAGSAGALTGV